MLYFVDTSDRPIINIFKPHIPTSRMKDEDATIPRICLSTSLEGCFSAAPWGSDSLEVRPVFTIYRVYEFDEAKIPDNHIIPTEKLMGKYDEKVEEFVEEPLVPDAEDTGETWVVEQNLVPDNMYYIILDKYDTNIIEYTNYDFFSVIKNMKYRKVTNIKFIKGITFNKQKDKESWLQWIMDCYTYFSYKKVDIKRKGNKVKITFPSPQAMATEHIDNLLERVGEEAHWMEIHYAEET